MKYARTGIRRSVGLRDIAEELNLSVSMVSKVLSGRMGNTTGQPETLRAIHEKAREMGYRKNLQAEALRTGRLNVIAVCVHHHGVSGSQIVENMVEGIARQAAGHHQRMVLHYFKTLRELHQIWGEFRHNAVDGVILGGVPHADWIREVSANADQDLPIVTILPAEMAADGIPNAGMSERAIARTATEHLLDRGCRRIAHFAVTLSDPDSFKQLNVASLRLEGYCQALESRGIPIQDELILPVDRYNYQYGVEAARHLLQSGIEFDGIVAQSDHQAVGAINTLIREGKSIPENVHITGIDNSPFCEVSIVPLSSVSQEFEPRGAMAVDMLLRKIEGNEVASVLVDPVLCVRASSQL